MTRKPEVPQIDPEALAAFQAGLRRRFSDEQLLDELRASARRLGRSPTMKEFAADPGARVHPQTVIEHFGTWNTAKRAAGLLPRRFVTREELLTALRSLGDELGRAPTVVEIKRRRGTMPSASLYWHTFGSLAAALREAGFDVTLAEERLERAISEGATLARHLGRLPRFGDWREARLADDSLLTEWQVYRLFEARRGAWATFQYLVRERLVDEGVTVRPDGTI
jgi:Homing endonuclease associated repeat